MCQKTEFEGDWSEFLPKFCLLRQSKNFSLLPILTIMIQGSGKSPHFAQKIISIKRLPLTNVENFLKLNFIKNQTSKSVLKQNLSMPK